MVKGDSRQKQYMGIQTLITPERDSEHHIQRNAHTNENRQGLNRNRGTLGDNETNK